MGEIRFQQSMRSVPNIQRVDSAYELWFTAFDAEGMEREVFVSMPPSVWPAFRQQVMELDRQRSLSADLVAEDPLRGIDSLAEAYETGGDVVSIWYVLVEALGRANVGELMTKQLGWERAHAIQRKIKGED
jgi:hypothetical protein